MASNPLREIASISRDIRKIGWEKLPRQIPRACLIFCNIRAHRNSESPKESLKIAKLAKYLNCEIFLIVDATLEEFIDAMRHFITEVTEFLLIFTAANRIITGKKTETPSIQFKDDSVDPELMYDLINCKNPASRVFLLMDAIDHPSHWDLSKFPMNRNGIYVMSAYPDSSQKETIQFDSAMNGVFSVALSKSIKANPDGTLASISKEVDKDLTPFGQKTYVSSHPSNLAESSQFLI